MNSIVAAILTLVIAVSFLRLMDFLAQRGWISGPLSRKIIHMGTGPIFVLCWLLFNDRDGLARYLAALVPLGITAQFALVGSGVMKDPAAVQGSEEQRLQAFRRVRDQLKSYLLTFLQGRS